MTVRRKAAGIAALGIAPLALTALAATPAAAHGSMTDPVSRIAACYAEGPESPDTPACKAAVAAGGTQALYDWPAVNMADAAGQSKERVPDGKLCSAGKDEYKGLDLPRGDWPSTRMAAGSHTFHYRATAPHKGAFALYITKQGYDPTRPLKWSDLESKPFAQVTDPKLENGEYIFDGTVPQRTGRQLIYSVWQRSDSEEAFYTCSDVVFGQSAGSSGAAAAPSASAPTEQEIADGAGKSSMPMHHGMGSMAPSDHATSGAAAEAAAPDSAGAPATGADAPEAQGGRAAPAAGDGQHLAETGGNSSTPYLAMGGAAALAIGAAALFAGVRRRSAR
ncbi:lytic polysaccharide monooxygenase [Streptomyces sp. NBC_00859]|uniref:lytic polysaccharide monooxygenase auxiliary activity family 9 protein n=1 Tax=Streptomyces sp. NBC_00859 TaxID=2903682 RepID=UPI0038652407|nr:lytic polysaccharide monooxygenase [Streptomyces sp. NBC_00859]